MRNKMVKDGDEVKLCLSDKVLIGVYLARRYKPNTPLVNIIVSQSVGAEHHEIVTELKRLLSQGYLNPTGGKGGPFNCIASIAGTERAEKLLSIDVSDTEDGQKKSGLDTIVKFWPIFTDTAKFIYNMIN